VEVEAEEMPVVFIVRSHDFIVQKPDILKDLGPLETDQLQVI